MKGLKQMPFYQVGVLLQATLLMYGFSNHGVAGENASNPVVIEEDIVLDETTKEIIFGRTSVGSRTKRFAVSHHVLLWPNGIVPYVIDSSIGPGIRKEIRRAFRQISKKSCISFIPKTWRDENYIKFVKGRSCYSSIGKKGGQQTISLHHHGCAFGATHEVMHALGFFHEQSRPDRDTYVRILWWNIQKGMERNFQNYPNGVTDTLDQPYNIKSIMHYGNKAFSRNGRYTMISRRRPLAQLGSKRGKPTKTDVAKLNKLYKCNIRSLRQTKHDFCTNILSGCYYYAVVGDNCEGNYEFMKHYCRKACGFC